MSNHRVLLVDDDDFTRMTLRAVLASLDYDVIGDAANVVAAMDLARAEGPTGIDLAHGLRTLVPSIGLVMLSCAWASSGTSPSQSWGPRMSSTRIRSSASSAASRS